MVHSKIEGKLQRFLIHLLPQHMHSLPIMNIPHLRAHLLHLMNLCWHHHYHHRPRFTWGFPLDVHFKVSDKCIMTCLHHYSIVQSSFTALKILCALPIHPSLPPTLNSHWSLYCLYIFAFSRISYEWNHLICSLFDLFSLNKMHLSFIHVVAWINT